MYPFKDNSPIFTNPEQTQIQLGSMGVHSRMEADGSQYASVVGLNTTDLNLKKTTGNYIQVQWAQNIC